jgi:hypothetical protein
VGTAGKVVGPNSKAHNAVTTTLEQCTSLAPFWDCKRSATRLDTRWDKPIDYTNDHSRPASTRAVVLVEDSPAADAVGASLEAETEAVIALLKQDTGALFFLVRVGPASEDSTYQRRTSYSKPTRPRCSPTCLTTT